MTSNNRNGITSKKPSTVFLMQNVDLGHTKVMKIRQRETLNHQGAMIMKFVVVQLDYIVSLLFSISTFFINKISQRRNGSMV